MSIKTKIRTISLLDYVVGLYAPHECVGCNTEGALLCESCRNMLDAPLAGCYRCNKPQASGRTCSECRKDGGVLISANCATHYTGVAKELIWRLKSERARSAAAVMGRHLADMYGDKLGTDVLVVPVPTAMRRVRARGYDQATLIARSFAAYAGLQYAPLLRRFGTQEQKTADARLRRVQLRGAFEVRDPQKVAGRRIILIDDVLTTGSTFDEAARVLYAQNAKAVGALAFAKVRQ